MTLDRLRDALLARQALPPERGPEGPQGERGEAGQDGADSVVPGPKGGKGDPGADSTVPGPKGDPGTAGKDGQGIEEVEAVSLPPGAAPKAIWGRTTGRLVLGIPEGHPGAAGVSGRTFGGGGGGGAVGPAGATGAAGPAGAQGIQGPAGAAGADAPSTLDVHLMGWDGGTWVPVLGDSTGRLMVTS